ncbi:MAG: hypothetical protein AB1726_18710 [Planctomycetota bacterium]
MQHSKAWTAGGLGLAAMTLASVMEARADSPAAVGSRLGLRYGFDGLPAVRNDFLPRDPVLIHNLAGGTLVGEVHRQLTVYDDGLAVLSRLEPWGEPAGTVAVEGIAPEILARLWDDLVLYGAGTQEDERRGGQDVPLATLTLLWNAHDGGVRAHTFSYFPALAEGSLAAVDAVVEEFIAAHFRDAAGTTAIDPAPRARGPRGIDATER